MRKGDVDRAALHELVGRIISPHGSCLVERTKDGTSTQVYRIRRGVETFYLRVAEEQGNSFASEVHVHELLRAQGSLVPAVVYFEPYCERLERSIMVTTEITGTPVGHRKLDDATRAVLRAAGRDLAIINSIPVDGFGWVMRDSHEVTALTAKHATYQDFALEQVEENLARLAQQFLTGQELSAIQVIIRRYAGWLEVEHACLAHGDFDTTHIYQHKGKYSGIIDFGEIRGANPFYDLGHFQLHDGERLPRFVMPYLLEGYQEVAQLPCDHEQHIRLTSVLIGIRALARSLSKPSDAYQQHLASALVKAVATLNRQA